MPKKIFILSICLLLLTACESGFPFAPATPTATITPTLLPTATASRTPSPTWTPLPPTATATSTTTPFPTQDFAGPARAIANGPVPCRTGPTNEYPLVVQLAPGESAAVIGKASAYWVVKPENAGQCWVDALLVTVSGPTAYLPDFATPPPIFKPPSAPTELTRIKGYCQPDYALRAYRLEIWLTWMDNSDDEQGFTLYRDANRIADLPPDTTQFIDTFILHSGGGLFRYYVVAYNSMGRTQSESLWTHSPCRS